MTVVEALRAGCAVVATAADGTREVAEDAVTGRLVPADDLAALVDVVGELLENPEEQLRFGSAGLAFVSGCFDDGTQAHRTEGAYDALLARVRRR